VLQHFRPPLFPAAHNTPLHPTKSNWCREQLTETVGFQSIPRFFRLWESLMESRFSISNSWDTVGHRGTRRMSRITKRWNSKLARFIMSYGVTRLAAQLGIRASAIYHWTAGRCSPDPVNAVAIQKLARRRRVTLSLTDIYRQRRQTHCKRGIKLALGSDVFETCKSPTRTAAKVVQFPVEPTRRAAIAQLSAK
jgi:hypothetical protein